MADNVANTVAVLQPFQSLQYSNLQGNVAANATLTAPLPQGGTFMGIFLRCLTAAGAEITVAQMKSEIGSVKLLMDGENIIDSTATQLLDLQAFDRMTQRNGILPLQTALSNARDVGSFNALALGTADVKSAQIQVTLGATVTNLAKVELWTAQVPYARPRGAHLRILRNPQTFAGTGEVELPSLPRQPNGLLLDYHITNAANVTYCRTRVNGLVTRNNVPVSVNSAELDEAGFTPQTGYFHVSFNQFRTGPNGLLLNNVNDLALTPSFSSAPTTFDVVQRYIHNWGAANFGA